MTTRGKRELSIFVDESGSFGDFNFRSLYFIISFVFHDQSKSIVQQTKYLNNKLSAILPKNTYFHAGPLIHGEDDFHNMPREKRAQTIRRVYAFMQNANLKCISFHVRHKEVDDIDEVISRLIKDITTFINEHLLFFLNYDQVKIYYDNGQANVTKILRKSLIKSIPNSIIKPSTPRDYNLHQAADLICTAKLTELKIIHGYSLKSELAFFGSLRSIKKDLVLPMNKNLFK